MSNKGFRRAAVGQFRKRGPSRAPQVRLWAVSPGEACYLPGDSYFSLVLEHRSGCTVLQRRGVEIARPSSTVVELLR